MFGFFDGEKRKEKAINEAIDFIDNDSYLKNRILTKLFTKDVVAHALAEVFRQEKNDLHDFLDMLYDDALDELKKYHESIMNKAITDVAIHKEINEKIKEILQAHPEYKSIKDMPETQKTIDENLKKFLDWCEGSNITQHIENIKEAVKK